PDGIRATGMFVDRPDNDFAGWNHVVAYYCSSDSWSGRQRTLAIDDEGMTPMYELYVHGAYIVDAIFDALEDGAESDDGTMTMPTIDGAEMVLLAGSSAGAGGVRSNADRVGEMLRESNPSVDYRIIVDAGFYPVDPHPPELAEADALEALDFKHEIIVSWRNGATDASCLTYHAGDERWCSDNSHLMAHHITTPAFVKQDLRDGAPGLYANARTYSNIMLEWFLQVEDGTFVPEEPDVPLAQMGLFAPNCDHHLNLNVSSFYDISLTNGADEFSMHDLASNWVQGIQPYRAIHSPSGDLTSVCTE
ncbi:MAG: pectin acetylesterase-family hydrolase, partial [Myxococcota bacterium]|nr:pectin acetylesterase-family hydrolase [Myxococcota bacterium]